MHRLTAIIEREDDEFVALCPVKRYDSDSLRTRIGAGSVSALMLGRDSQGRLRFQLRFSSFIRMKKSPASHIH